MIGRAVIRNAAVTAAMILAAGAATEILFEMFVAAKAEWGRPFMFTLVAFISARIAQRMLVEDVNRWLREAAVR